MHINMKNLSANTISLLHFDELVTKGLVFSIRTFFLREVLIFNLYLFKVLIFKP